MSTPLQFHWAGFLFFAVLYSVLLLFGILLVPFFLVVACIGVFQLLFGLRSSKRAVFLKKASVEVLELAEATLLQEEVSKATCEHLWHELSASTGAINCLYRVHCIKATIKHKDTYKPPLLMLHGTAGAAVSFCWAFDSLAEHYDVYSVDMPGFGRSDIPPEVNSFAPPQLTEFYVQFLAQYMKALGLEQAYVFSHSFGAFLSINFAERYPDKITKLILADCPGLLPTMGMNGPFFSWFFGNCLPQSLIRTLGTPGFFVLYTMYDLFNIETMKYFDLQVWYRSTVDPVIKNYFSSDFPYLNWAYPAIAKLLNLNMPLAFIYGECDPIIPPHHAIAAVNIIDAEVPVYIIGGAAHNPADNRATAGHFSKAVLQGFQQARAPGEKARAFGAVLDTNKMCTDYKGTYSLKYNRALAQRLYDDLRMMVPSAVRGPVLFLGDKPPGEKMHEGLEMRNETRVLEPGIIEVVSGQKVVPA